jgi:hypothetical protein
MRPFAIAVPLVMVAVGVASAAEWDNVRPGISTQDNVRTQFGAPTKQSSQKVEGYDSVHWLYEGDQAPRGMVRVTLDFGILTPQGYRAEILRVMRLEPRPGVFTRATVLAGWGSPQRVGKDKDVDVFFYESGLLVYFAKEGWVAQTMIFTPPQRPGEGGAPPPR